MSGRSAQWEKVKWQAFERDRKRNAPCALCHNAIDYSLGMATRGGKDYNPKAYQADHIIPFNVRPELELDLANVQPSHAGCNKSKLDKAGINVLGEPDEDWWS